MIVLDAFQPTEEVLSFYRERMKAAGWQEWMPPVRPGGFVPTLPEGVRLCRGEQGPSLQVFALSREEITDVRISWTTDPERSPCARRFIPEILPWREILPSLVIPEDARYLDSDMGGSDRAVHSDITLESELSAQELLEHYAKQLEEAGWERLEGGRSGRLAWVAWSFASRRPKSHLFGRNRE
jgi:hypothetical protein